MIDAQLQFHLQPVADPQDVSDAIHGVLGAFRKNGQICGREWPIVRMASTCAAYVLLPAPDALSPAHHNLYVQQSLAGLGRAFVSEPQIDVLGEDLESGGRCVCGTPPSYVLYTHYLSLEPPVRCGGCFLPVPLYSLPPTNDGEYSGALIWQSDYQSCDSLQMNCRVLVRGAMRQLSRIESPLTRDGLGICQEWTLSTGVPVYYYLYRYGARSHARELARLCPLCGGSWLLEQPWHLFDFKCDRCRLVSNIAWDVRP